MSCGNKKDDHNTPESKGVSQIADKQPEVSANLLAVLSHIPALISIVDEMGKVLFVSEHHTLLLEVAKDKQDIERIVDLFPQANNSEIERFLKNTENPQVPWVIDITHKSGEVFTYQMHKHRLTHRDNGNSNQSNEQWLIWGVNVSEKMATETVLRDHQSQIAYLTYHDQLTGLANRTLFSDRMGNAMHRIKRSQGNLAIMLIGLDRFKHINDSLGQKNGDDFLVAVSKKLAKLVRQTDTIARLGGDEFVLVLEDVRDLNNIDLIANKILEELSGAVSVAEQEIGCTASIGISLYPKDGDTTDKLLRSADLAMSCAKQAGKNRSQYYLKAMSDSAMNYLLLENDLRKAIEHNHLLLHYQPQIDLISGEIVGVEALVRWKHPEKGLISPAEFIPLAEETGLIEPIGEWVLRHAAERFSAWLSQGVNLGKVAVNLSARQFRQDAFENTVRNILLETKLDPRHLELEITESSVMENAVKTIAVLEELSGMGLSIAIDDFGTGYSSLTYLRRFPVDKLKVDRSFIKDIDVDENDGVITKSIIDLGHNMSLKVIAEGVENATQRDWLINRGCDQVQGFFYSRPLPENELLALVGDTGRVVKGEHFKLINY